MADRTKPKQRRLSRAKTTPTETLQLLTAKPSCSLPPSLPLSRTTNNTPAEAPTPSPNAPRPLTAPRPTQPTTPIPATPRRQSFRALSEAPSIPPPAAAAADQPQPQPHPHHRRNTLSSVETDSPTKNADRVKSHARSFSGTDDKPSSVRPLPSSINRNRRILCGSTSSEEQAQTLNTARPPRNERNWDAFTGSSPESAEWDAFLARYSNGDFDNILPPGQPAGRMPGPVVYNTSPPVARSAPASLRRPTTPRTMSTPATPTMGGGFNKGSSPRMQPFPEAETIDYLQPPLSPDEIERRRALYSFRILGTAPDVDFDRIVDICKQVFETEICLISLVNIDTQWFKAENGLGYRSTGRGESFCGHAILRKSDDPLVVLDALDDWRFKTNPLVVESPYIRFYAGAPLRTKDGYAIGTLCIIDPKPRTSFPQAKRELLVKFASNVMHEIYLWSDRLHLKSFKRMHENFGAFQKQCLEDEHLNSSKGHSLLLNYDDHDRKNFASMQREFDVACRLIHEGLDVDKVILAKVYPGSIVSTPSNSSSSSSSSSNSDPSGIFKEQTHTVVVSCGEEAPHAWRAEGNDYDAPSVVKHLEYRFDTHHRRPFSSTPTAATPSPTPPRFSLLSSHASDSAPTTLSDDAILRLLEQRPEVISLLTKGPENNTRAIFQNDFPIASTTGYCSAIIVPTIMSASSAPTMTTSGLLPFGVLIALTSNPTRQLEWEETTFMYNFGVSIVSQVVKRSVVVADRAKSAFISGISHELRTPLHGILAVLELLIPPSSKSSLSSHHPPETSDIFPHPLHTTQPSPCSYDPLTPTQNALLQTIESCGKSLISIINNVLDLAKLESGKRKVGTMERVSLISLVEEVGEAMFGGVHNKDVEFLVSVEDDEEMVRLKESRSEVGKEIEKGWRQRWMFKSDAGCLRQILLNLVGNALKFTTKGFVHLSVSRPAGVPSVTAGGVTKHPIMFTVSDSGRGISQDFMRTRLFQPFSQEDPLQQGTGLGLRICFELVEKMGGRIEVESSGVAGEGCVFRVLIWCEEELKNPGNKMLKIIEAAEVIDKKKVRVLMDEKKRIKRVLEKYFGEWWAMDLLAPEDNVEEDIIVLDNNLELLKKVLMRAGDQWKAKEPHILFLTSLANHGEASAIVSQVRQGYGYCGNVVLATKPAGPSKVLAGLYECFVAPPLTTPSDDTSGAESEQFDDMVSLTTGGSSSRHSSIVTPGEGSLTRRLSMAQDGYFASHVAARTPKGLYTSAEHTLHEEHEDEHFRPSLSPPPPVVSSPPPIQSDPSHPGRTVSYFDPRAVRVPPDSGLITPPSFELPSPYIHHRSPDARKELVHLQQIVRRPSLPISLPQVSAEALTASSMQSRDKKHRSFPSTPNSESHPTEKGEPPKPFSPSLLVDKVPSVPNDSSSVAITNARSTSLLVPTAESSAATASPPQTPPTPLVPPPRVLIVEDNSTNRLILAMFLRKRRVPFVEAENGAVGADLFQKEMDRNKGVKGYDVVLMDINMPVMNGNMATAEIRRIERENGIYPDSDDMQNHNLQRRRSLIYALTGLASDQDKKLAFDCGVDGFLTKPVSLRILADILDRYFPNTTAPFNPTAKSPGTPMSSTSTPLLPKQSKKTLELPRAAEKKVDGAVA